MLLWFRAIACVAGYCVATAFGMQLHALEPWKDDVLNIDSDLQFFLQVLDVRPFAYVLIVSSVIRSEREVSRFKKRLCRSSSLVKVSEARGTPFPYDLYFSLLLSENRALEWLVWLVSNWL